jgi:hypothetical protein
MNHGRKLRVGGDPDEANSIGSAIASLMVDYFVQITTAPHVSLPPAKRIGRGFSGG